MTGPRQNSTAPLCRWLRQLVIAVGLFRVNGVASPSEPILQPQDGSGTKSTATPSTNADSDDELSAESDQIRERRWLTLARQRHVPGFIKRYALRRMGAFAARHSVRYFGRSDPTDNEETRLPSDERVQVPAIWLTELYTPTTLTGLIDGLPRLLTKARGTDRAQVEIIEWVRRTRRQGGGAWRMLPYVFPPNSKLSWPDRVVDELPKGIAYAYLGIHTLTSTITAVTVEFRLDEENSQELGAIINRDMSTETKPLPRGGRSIRDVRWQKQEAADAWRARLRNDAAHWLAERLPGSFSRLSPGQLPTLELLLTEQLPAWEEQDDGEHRVSGWRELLDLEDFDGYWQCVNMTWLRLRERRFRMRQPGQRHVLTLAGTRPELLQIALGGSGEADQIDSALRQLGFYIVPLANCWAQTTLLRELDEQLAVTRDLTEQASSKRSPRALAQVQRQLIHTGMDSQIVAADIVHYAERQMTRRHNGFDFTEVPPPSIAQRVTPKTSLAETLLKGQIDHGTRVTQAEADIRDLLSTSAQLTAAAENLRLQRRVLWLTIVSLLVAAIAAAAAVIALRTSGSPSTPAPTVPPSPSPIRSSALPQPTHKTRPSPTIPSHSTASSAVPPRSRPQLVDRPNARSGYSPKSYEHDITASVRVANSATASLD
jgi:hypothetical protein